MLVSLMARNDYTENGPKEMTEKCGAWLLPLTHAEACSVVHTLIADLNNTDPTAVWLL